MIRKFTLIAVLFTAAQLAFAQYNTTIRTARPGQSFGPFTTGKDVFQVQTGFNFNNAELVNPSDDFNGFNYLLSLRYGLTETFEIRSAFQFNNDKLTSGNSEQSFSGLSTWNVGVRANILNNGGTRKPSLAFQADARITAVSEDFKAADLAPRLQLLHGQAINDWLSLTTNWGLAWNGNDTNPRGFYTMAFSFPLSEKWGGFVENYGEIIQGDYDTRFDTGISYLAHNDLSFDTSVGYGKNDGLSDFFFDFGVSFRIVPQRLKNQ